MSGSEWKQLEYQIQGSQPVVDQSSPPFDGEPVLLLWHSRIIQCRWVVDPRNQLNAYWHGADDHDYPLGRYFWKPVIDLRDKEVIYDHELAQAKSLSGEGGLPVLIYVETCGWLSAYYDAPHCTWISPSELTGVPEIHVLPEFVRMGCDFPELPEPSRITGAFDPIWG